MMVLRRGLGVLGAIYLCSSACSATKPAPAGESGYQRVDLALDASGLHVLALRAAAPKVAHGAGELYFELRNDRNAIVASGRVADPRRLHSEWLEGSVVKRADVLSPVGSLSLVLPGTPGTITLYDLANGTKHALGSAQYEPSAAKGVASSGLTQATTIHPGTDKLRVVLVSEGYTSAELGKFAKDAALFADDLLSGPDWGSHEADITVLRVDIASNQSGIDDPKIKLLRDTAFDAGFSVGDNRRCIWFGTPDGETRARTIANDLDASMVAMIVNTSEYGGCASHGIMSSSTNDTRVLPHELGHAALDLADEYDYGTCDVTATAPNVSASAKLSKLPWSDLVNSSELPTLDQSPGAIGAFEGAAYCTRNMFRPEHDCLMRTLGVPMCAVCRREMDRFFAKTGVGSCVGVGCPTTGGGSGGSVGNCVGVGCDSGGGSGADGAAGFGGGKSAPDASCQGYCGSADPVPQSSPGCYCDADCSAFGDCCADVSSVCPAPAATCQGHCGSSDPLPGSDPSCYCDSACSDYGDCCDDAYVCG